ncbi:MAG TPA: NAD(P)H-binding protein [Myxococcota bacterium]|nr:NAD(P)H-binding protein [Myxococcota bacterium]
MQGAAQILVTGANGQLGRRVLQRLAHAQPPRRARAVVRSERAAKIVRASAGASAELRIASGLDAEALSVAATGCDAAVHLAGILKETRANRYEDAHERPARALADAAAKAGLRRIVSVSILGSRPDSSHRALASKGRADEILLSGTVPALVLRVPMVLGPGDPASEALRRQALAGHVSLVRGGATLEQPIAAADVVEAIAAALARPEPLRGAVDLAGPESLTHRELVLRAARVLGRDVRVRSIPYALAFGFAWLAERLLANPPLTPAMLGVLEHDDAIDPADACRRLGISLTPLDETLRRALLAAEEIR